MKELKSQSKRAAGDSHRGRADLAGINFQQKEFQLPEDGVTGGPCRFRGRHRGCVEYRRGQSGRTCGVAGTYLQNQ